MIDHARKGHWDQFRMAHYSVEDILRLRVDIEMPTLWAGVDISMMQNSMRLIKKTYPDVANTMGMDLDGMQKMYEELGCEGRLSAYFVEPLSVQETGMLDSLSLSHVIDHSIHSPPAI